MKVMQRGIMKIVPGKMAEAMELMGKYMAVVSRLLGMPAEKLPMKIYYPFIGGGDSVNTIVFEMEWDSFGEMAAFFEKAMADAEIQATMPKWQVVEQSHEVELYMAAPMP
jgi:spore maturation protein SpmB